MQSPPSGKMTDQEVPATVSLRLATLTKRKDFLRASRAKRVVTPGFVLQMRRRADGEAVGVRVGFTCSKKVGNAVARNRAKRRLREISRIVLPAFGKDGTDYVLIGRRDTTDNLPIDRLIYDLRKAILKLHEPVK